MDESYEFAIVRLRNETKIDELSVNLNTGRKYFEAKRTIELIGSRSSRDK